MVAQITRAFFLASLFIIFLLPVIAFANPGFVSPGPGLGPIIPPAPTCEENSGEPCTLACGTQASGYYDCEGICQTDQDYQPNGGSWSGVSGNFTRDFAAGEYLSGMEVRYNCDYYSSEDGCMALKVDSVASGEAAYQPNGGAWTPYAHNAAWELAPGQYFSGISFRGNCDFYSSEDGCMRVKIAQASPGETAYHTNSNGAWTGWQNNITWELEPGEYISGIQFRTNCDYYSSADDCWNIKISSAQTTNEAEMCAPNTPTITGPTEGEPSTSYTFGFQASDPDSAELRYGIDWDNNGSVDSWLPSSGHVAQDTLQETGRSWSSDGDKIFKALAEDTDGETSGWASHTISLITLSACSDGVDNDGDGLIDYPSDGGCATGAGTSEVSECQDGIDNDGNGLIDLADGGCGGGNDDDEYTVPQCQDGIDNNGNGLIDYPDDAACSTSGDSFEEVLPSASLSLAVNPSLVRSGGTVELNWEAQNASDCTITGTDESSWNLSGTSGTVVSAAITAHTEFTLACTDLDSDPVSISAQVKLIPSFREVLRSAPLMFALVYLIF